MRLRCGHDSDSPAPEACTVCRLLVTRPDYRALLLGQAAAPAGPDWRSRLAPCRFLGSPTGEARPCSACNATSPAPVLACDLHGECTRDRLVRGLECCRLCPDRSPWPVRLDQHNLSPGSPGLRFNPSLLAWQGRHLLAYRSGWKGSDVYLCWLDDRLRPDGRAWRLALDHPGADYGREDPRLFVHRGRVHVSFIGVVGGRTIRHTNQLYARLTEGLAVEAVFLPQGAPRNLWEKNWQFFEHEDGLYAVYSWAPHRVLAVEGDRCRVAYESHTAAPWPGGEVRGGAAPVRVGGEYWCFFHDRVEGPDGHRTYRAGLYTFEAAPPFRVLRVARGPWLSADRSTKPADQYASVVWPAGAVRRGDHWVLAVGVHDRWSELHRVEHARLEASLYSARPPAGWLYTDGPPDLDVWRQVTQENEYRLPDAFAPADVVLDVGAHVGTFAHACLTRGAGRVVSVEAYAPRAAQLRHNLALSWPGRHDVVEAACWRSDRPAGPVRLFAGEGGDWGAFDAQAAPLSALVEAAAARSPSGRVRLLKLDCEGSEWPALATLPPGGLARVDEVCGEYHLGAERWLGPEACAGLPPFTLDWLRGRLGAEGLAVTFEPRENGIGLFWARRH